MATSASLHVFCCRPFFFAARSCLRASSRALANSADFEERFGVLGLDRDTALEPDVLGLISEMDWKEGGKYF